MIWVREKIKAFSSPYGLPVLVRVGARGLAFLLPSLRVKRFPLLSYSENERKTTPLSDLGSLTHPLGKLGFWTKNSLAADSSTGVYI
jgi:hypothetical protein